MKPIAWLIALQLILVFSLPCAAADIIGQATVVDGDTIEIHGKLIRLFGIDAPEGSQTCTADGKTYLCGHLAALTLADLVGRQVVSCEQRDFDPYWRIVAICFAGSDDLGAQMVEQGWALAYRRDSKSYVGQEQAAKSSHRGIWRGEFVPPWDWRNKR
jgi:endonuclease YncB( thermonuclease family)